MKAMSWEPLCYYTVIENYLHLGPTHKAIHSSSIRAIKCYGHSAVIMDEEQLKKENISIYHRG